jgi:hypothetical protein
MTPEKSPAQDYTRDKPLILWTDDNSTKLEVFAESGGVSSSATARVSNPQWIVRVNGLERAGWGEATIYDTEWDVRTNALGWYGETSARDR